MIIKIRKILFLVLISVNYLAAKCIEEPSASEDASEILEKSEFLATDALSSEKKAEEVDAYEEVSQSNVMEPKTSSNADLDLIDERAELDDLSHLTKTETELNQRSANDEKPNDRKPEELESPKSTSAEPLNKEKEKSGENMEKQEFPEISKSVPEIKEKKAEHHLEASAESKHSDNGMTSTINEKDRTESKVEDIKKKVDEVGLHEIVTTRRMISKPEVFLDKKARSDPSVVAPEDKTALDPTINAYSNSEFGSGNNKLIDRAHVSNQNNGLKFPQPMMDHTSLKSFSPEIRRVESQQIINQQNQPQLYSASQLNLDFPAFHLQQHKPYGVPIYLELEQDQEKLKKYIMGAQNPQMSQGEQYHQSQNNLDAGRFPVKNQYKNIEHGFKNPNQQFPQKRLLTNVNSANENTYNMENVLYNTRNRNQQFPASGTKTTLMNNPYDNQKRPIIPPMLPIDLKTSSENTYFTNLGQPSRNQAQLQQNPGKMALEYEQPKDLHHERNRLQQIPQYRRIMDPNLSPLPAFDNLSQEKFASGYPNMKLFKSQEPNILKTPATNLNFDLSSENFRKIYHTLANATGPSRIVNHLQNINKPTYPNFLNPINDGPYSYDVNSLSRSI